MWGMMDSVTDNVLNCEYAEHKNILLKVHMI